MALSRKAIGTIVLTSVGSGLLLLLLWAVVAPAVLSLPLAWWGANALASLGMVLIVQLAVGLINLRFRLRRTPRRLAELPLRLLVALAGGSLLAVLSGWILAYSSFPSPHGLALPVLDLGLGVLGGLAFLPLGRVLLKREESKEFAAADTGQDPLPRLTWSRVGLRGYLLLVVCLLGAGSALSVTAVAHVSARQEALRSGRRSTRQLLRLASLRLEAVPRERLLDKLFQMRLPAGHSLRVANSRGQVLLSEQALRSGRPAVQEQRGPRGRRVVRLERLVLSPDGSCRLAASRAHCHWIPLRFPHEGLRLVTYYWPLHAERKIRTSAITMTMVFFCLGLLFFGGAVAYLMGSDTSRDLSGVADRIASIAKEPEEELSRPLQATSTDEMGDLVRRFGELRHRLLDELERHQSDLARSFEADQAKTGFLEEVSFDLRTALTAVMGYAELLIEGADGPLNADQQDEAQIVHDSAGQLLGLVRDILDISIIETGGFRLEIKPTDLVGLVQSELTVARAGLEAKPVSLQSEVADGLPVVQLDPVQIRRVLANLLSNAIKFTEQGEIRVEVGAAAGEVRVEVSDTGSGIAVGEQDSLFDQYRQASQARHKKIRGSGLGLAIVKQLVLLHGGQVGLESEPGRGSRFFFTLPVEGPPPRGSGPEDEQ